jgi:adenylate cyclase
MRESARRLACCIGGHLVAEERAKRKLTAILSADVAGYSRLMEDDDEATVRTITSYRDLMVIQIQNQNGQVVDAKGDNLLAEFSSVVDAVRCAVEIQKELAKENTLLPKHRRMEFRIGVNLGDVIEEGDTIYGDGVNIASRLEGVAEEGGICISGSVYDQVENKLGLEFEYLGEKTVKNIKKPIRAFRVKIESVATDVEMGEELPLPNRPSIAVLPFVNMSGDPEQEYFSDGISEDIITALSRNPDMFVIARNSTFAYKGKSANVQQVGRELGVRYVLEGSVRKAGNRVRITAQLIDAKSGHHLWADRYDRNLEDVFAIQDEITFEILQALGLKLTLGEQVRLYAQGAENIDSYLKMMEARSYLGRFEKGSNLRTRQICEEIIALEPNWDAPYCVLGWTHWFNVRFGWSESPVQDVQTAFQLAEKALSLGESMYAHALLSHLYTGLRQYEKAAEEAEKSIALGPSSADAYSWYAYSLLFAGESSKAISLLENAMRLNPFPPGWYFTTLGAAYARLGNHDKAIEALKKAIYKEPTDLFARIAMAVSYAMSGRESESQDQAKEILKIYPSFSINYFAKALPYRDESVTAAIADALQKAGLPE